MFRRLRFEGFGTGSIRQFHSIINSGNVNICSDFEGAQTAFAKWIEARIPEPRKNCLAKVWRAFMGGLVCVGGLQEIQFSWPSRYPGVI